VKGNDKIVDLGAWKRRNRGSLGSLSDVDLLGETVAVTDEPTGRIDGLLWVRRGLGPSEEAAVIQAALDERFPEGY
jgi:hypothetical protein